MLESRGSPRKQQSKAKLFFSPSLSSNMILSFASNRVLCFSETRDIAGIKVFFKKKNFFTVEKNELDFLPEKFQYAALSGMKVSSFKMIFEDQNNDEEMLKGILKILFGSILNKFYEKATPVRCNLFQLYDFDGRGWSWAVGGTDNPDKIAERVATILKVEDANCEKLKFGEYQVENLVHFMRNKVLEYRKKANFFHLSSFIHGDLNCNNFLLDENRNLFLIDFEYCEKGHIFKDITKVENDLVKPNLFLISTQISVNETKKKLFFHTKIENEEQLKEMYSVVKSLSEVKDILTLPKTPLDVFSPHILRTFRVVYFLREIVSKNLSNHKRSFFEISVPLLRYALHTVCLPSGNLSKRAALFAACLYCERIKDFKRFTTEGFPLFSVPSALLKDQVSQGRLSFSFRLGFRSSSFEVKQSIQQDIEDVVSKGVDHIFDFTSPLETKEVLFPPNLSQLSEEAKVSYSSHSFLQRSTPSLNFLLPLLSQIKQLMEEKKHVLLLSSVGCGRSPLVAACFLLFCDKQLDASFVLEQLEQVRKESIPETEEQLNFILNFKDNLKRK